MNKSRLNKMNRDIATWLWGAGIIIKSGRNAPWVWRVKGKSIAEGGWKFSMNFHENAELLNQAFHHAMIQKEDLWYGIHKRGIGWKSKSTNAPKFRCFIATTYKIGFGSKFNNNFNKESIILAMHYSLWRYIKNGIEY